MEICSESLRNQTSREPSPTINPLVVGSRKPPSSPHALQTMPSKASLRAYEALAPTASFDLEVMGVLKTASWPLMRRPRARSSFAPNASLPISSVFLSETTYRWLARRGSSRRASELWTVCISWARGEAFSDGVKLSAVLRCDGAMLGARVGVML
jgi:hypothetical protein